MVAGAAARVAAAFNTPLGGIVFAIEQLTRRRDLRHSNLTIAAIVLAGLVSISVFGNESYFGALVVPVLDWSLLAPAWRWRWPPDWPAGCSRGCWCCARRAAATASAGGAPRIRCALPPPAGWRSA